MIECFADDNKIAIRTTENQYFVIENDSIKINGTQIEDLGKFEVHKGKIDGSFAFQGFNSKYIVAEPKRNVLADRTRIGKYESFIIEESNSLNEESNNNNLTNKDVSFVRPNGSGPDISPITGYNWRDYHVTKWSNEPSEWGWEWPLINKDIMNRDKQEYWDNLVEELLFSRVDVIALHGRGAWHPEDQSKIGKGTGDMDPRILTRFVDAVDRVGDGAREAIKVAMWDDTGMYPDAYKKVTGLDNFDISQDAAADFMFDYNIKLWFDTLPKDMWYTIDKRPVIASWTFVKNGIINQGNGNTSKLVTRLCDKFNERYGVRPWFILQRTWFDKDESLNNNSCVKGKHNWISPYRQKAYSYETFKGFISGVIAPGFAYSPNSPSYKRPPTDRKNGKTLEEALSAGIDSNFILLEGWTNLIESAGFYRSNNSRWLYPNQYINIVRKYSDPSPVTLRFQAEAADSYYDTTPENTLGDYSSRGIDVKRFDNGWYVGDTKNGEWLEFKDIMLGEGAYRFTLKAATRESGKKIKLSLPQMQEITLPNTNGKFQLFTLGDTNLDNQLYNIRLDILSDDIDIDWFHMRKK